MKTWQHADELLDKLELQCKNSEGRLCYASLLGMLEGNLKGIFIELGVYHPEAFSRVLNYLGLEECK